MYNNTLSIIICPLKCSLYKCNRVSMEASNLYCSVATKKEEPDRQDRPTWSGKIDFLLACIGFSVGLGNVWRFPYLCYKNGGGAFLIPYFVSVFITGIPVFILEVSMGQFMSKGGIEAWNLCPLFKGIGVASVIIIFFLNCYYNVILSWTIYYIASSFNSVLPWSSCNNTWNTERCLESSSYNHSLDTGNLSVNVNYSAIKVDPVTEYWEYRALGLSKGIEEMGSIKWDLALCLLAAWIIVFFCICRGIKSTGKVLYVIAPTPYVLMLILLFRASTLEGAWNGLKFYLLPNWSKLADMTVWADAGTQVFFSYSLSLGTLQGLGSYNKFHHNSFRDCVIFACVNSGTSVFAGFVIFMTLGYMSFISNTPISQVAGQGPGLAFIAYPKALARMPIAPMWSVLFFSMLLMLGLSSQIVSVEGFVTAISDIVPKSFIRGKKKTLIVMVICIIKFFVGLSMVTNGGMYVFQLFDYYTGSRIILIVALFECFVVSYIYGINRYLDNIKMMFKFPLASFMKINWTITTPIYTGIIMTLSALAYSELVYHRGKHAAEYRFPQWSVALGWTMACSSVIMIPIFALKQFLSEKGTPYERLTSSIRPRLRQHQMRPQDDPKELIPEAALPEKVALATASPLDVLDDNMVV